MNKSLYYQEGGSDKEYHIQVVEQGDGFVVNFQFGRRGSALQHGTKTQKPVPLKDAEKIFIKLANEKIRKGYVPSEDAQEGPSGEIPRKEVVFVPQLLNEVQDPETYIKDTDYAAQEKFDGERRMIKASDDGIIGINKKGQAVPLPDAVKKSVGDFRGLIDGEIIGDKVYVFDIVPEMPITFVGRLVLFQRLHFGKNIVIVPTAYTTKEKQDLFDRIQAENGEGIVFKKKDAKYTSGRPNSGGNALKFKFHKTGTFIVAGSTPGKRSVGLEMIDDNGDRQFMGKVTIPANKEIPQTGDFVEVRYLYAYKGGAIFQPVYIDKRTDADLSDCTTKQLIYKKD